MLLPKTLHSKLPKSLHFKLPLTIIGQGVEPPSAERDTTSIPKYVYGIKGIAELFGCSAATASRIKKDGVIKEAITQFKRTIVVDTEKALELMKERKGTKEF